MDNLFTININYKSKKSKKKVLIEFSMFILKKFNYAKKFAF